MEIWKDIEGYNGRYMISTKGRVKNSNGLILKQRYDKDGYKRVTLSNGRKQLKTFLIHRLVAEAFINNPKEHECVNHIDEDKENNNVKNLEWCTRAYNNIYSRNFYRKKRSKKRKVRNLTTNEIFKSTTSAAKKYGVVAGAIYNCCMGRTNTSAGYQWEFF